MSEFVDGILGGTFCQACGAAIRNAEGLGKPSEIPRYCRDCGGDPGSAGANALHEFPCQCGMKFRSQQELADHQRAVHP